jgi:hypothetical protein
VQIERLNGVQVLQEIRLQRWKKKRLKLARRIIPVEFWPQGQEAWFFKEAITDPEMTAQTAALRILGAKMKLGNDAVLKLVKKGKEMLPPKILEKMERTYAAIDSNDSWQFLNQLDPLR